MLWLLLLFYTFLPTIQQNRASFSKLPHDKPHNIPFVHGPEDEPIEYKPTAAQKLMRHVIKRRGPDIVKPKRNISEPVKIMFKMELYQIIELNERQQFVAVSAWVIERWFDEFLYWNPMDFDNITEIKLHHSHIWIPDTTLYNTLVMKDDDQRRLLYVKITTDFERKRAYVEFLYPAIYKFYCRLYLQFFPFDSQTCHMIFGSWTSDNMDIDYDSLAKEVGTSNYLPNEGWSLMATGALRKEVKYVCCPNNYTLLDFTLYLRRRPLFYLVNLVIPTFIITLIAITGFFTTSSTTGVRDEKISLCITTLLSMSILMLMVSDQMPSTSTFIPLISWFYMCAIFIISIGALAASFVISVQKFGRVGERLPKNAVEVTTFFSTLSMTRIPPHLIQKKDKLLEKLQRNGRKSAKESERKGTTIAQFAKYIFTAGNEIAFYPPYMNPHIQAYPGATPNGCSNGTEPLMQNGTTDSTSILPNVAAPVPTYKRPDVRRTASILSDLGDEEVLSTRHLAKIEYDWLATVIERCTFLVFLLVFLCFSLGINLVGVFHWLNSQPPPYAVRTQNTV
ncbi:unnamed protein product [Auanema sp. JU1783]|nr:unnamed protein product [Auanema sp. JU1783]